MPRPKLVGADKYYMERRVGNIHVSVSDAEVRNEVLGLCARAQKAKPPEGRERPTDAYCRALAEYAVGVHQKNRGQYLWVMRGRSGRWPKVPL
jgi:hypothetical protein